MILSDRRIPVNMSSSISGLRMHRLMPMPLLTIRNYNPIPADTPTKQTPPALLAEERSLYGVGTG